MFGRRILRVVIAAALLLLGFSDCLTSATLNAQAMRCCAQLDCASGQQKLECFAIPAPGDGPQTVPEGRASLVAPSIAAVLHLPAVGLIQADSRLTGVVEASQHSPPELYTFHLALLI